MFATGDMGNVDPRDIRSCVATIALAFTAFMVFALGAASSAAATSPTPTQSLVADGDSILNAFRSGDSPHQLALEAVAGQWYVIECLPDSNDPWLDLSMNVTTGSGLTLSDDDSGPYLMPRIIIFAERSEQVIVDVRAVSEWSSGAYSVRARTITPALLTGVVLGVSDIPSPGAAVTAYALDANGFEAVARTKTGSDGSWTLPLEAGTYRIGYRASGSSTEQYYGDASLESAQDIVVAKGEKRDLGQGSAIEWARLRGIVADQNGRALAGVRVSIYRESGGVWRAFCWTTSDALGTWAAALASGTYKVGYSDQMGVCADTYHPGAPSLDSGDVVVLGSSNIELSARLRPAVHPVTVQSVAGVDRYDTAVRLSQQTYPGGSDTVVLVTGTSWPDGLGAASLAGALEAPVLLTRPHSLPTRVADEIARLGAERIIVVGGSAAVSEDVVAALQTDYVVERIGGVDRYDTAARVAAATVERLEQRGEQWDGRLILASGQAFPDVLAASPLSASMGWPVLLTRNSHLPAVTRRFVTDATASGVVLVGGPSAVSSQTEADLTSLGIEDVERVWGNDRYATALAVSQYAADLEVLDYRHLAVATGQDFPDALACGVRQAAVGSVLLLTPSRRLDSNVADLIAALPANACEDVTFVGGASALSLEVRDQMVEQFELAR